jgi:general secretion pathway protein G
MELTIQAIPPARQRRREAARPACPGGAAPAAAPGQAGFTLIEIMVVIAILAILAAVVVPKLIGRTDDARITATKVQIKNIEQALNLYKLDNGVYPSTEQGLDALVREPTIGVIPRNWKEGGYLPKVPMDQWGNPFVYIQPGQESAFDLYSYGADGEEGGTGPATDIKVTDLG